MGYELRTMVVEPKRQTFDNLVERFGDRPASRYQEGSFDLQATENFHYMPTWDTAHQIYDPDYTALKLTDPYSYVDPRQFYYATYVADAAARYESFAQTLKYIEDRRLLDRLPDDWRMTMVTSVLPLRHYEQAGQMISSNACRFAWGTTISQACVYAAFDRIGNAQVLSLVGLALAGGAADTLTEAKKNWLHARPLQGLRRVVEESLVERDWAAGLVAIDLADTQLYPMLFAHMDERSLFHGAGAYSLIARHLNDWYVNQKKWLQALLKAWANDPEHGEANRKALGDIAARWYPQVTEAVRSLAEGIAGLGSATVLSAAERGAAEALADLTKLGVPVPTSQGA
jgi:phenol/toluene 2-monooxygenase (NADH) P1/A1